MCTLVIPNSLLLHLHEDGNGYIQGVNSCISGHLVSLNPSCSRIESALRRIAGKLVTKRRNCKGSHARQKLKDGNTNLLVGDGETVKECWRGQRYDAVCICRQMCVNVYT